MQFIKDISENSHVITGIDSGAIRVDDEIVTGSLVLTASTLDPWPVSGIAEIRSEHWEIVFASEPEIVLLGTGSTLRFPESHQLREAYDRQIGVEVMDTQAACRTYNLLVHERRRVAAALILSS